MSRRYVYRISTIYIVSMAQFVRISADIMIRRGNCTRVRPESWRVPRSVKPCTLYCSARGCTFRLKQTEKCRTRHGAEDFCVSSIDWAFGPFAYALRRIAHGHSRTKHPGIGRIEPSFLSRRLPAGTYDGWWTAVHQYTYGRLTQHARTVRGFICRRISLSLEDSNLEKDRGLSM